MNVTLQLRYCPAPQRTAAAWLIPGGDVAAWLAELTAWNVPLAEARLLPLADGLLVWFPKPVPPIAGAAQAYGRAAEQVLLPVEAAIEPPVTERELARLLSPDGAHYVWHPRHGLARYEPAAVQRIANLLAPPKPTGISWDAAQSGVAFNQRLLSIEPTQRPTLEDLLEAARDGIATDPMAGGKLPAQPGEPIGGAIGQAVAQAGLTAAAAAAGAMGAAASAMAAGMQSLAGALTGAGQPTGSTAAQSRQSQASGAGGSNWLSRLAEWAKAQQQAAASNLDRLRNRQIERLLNMLKDTPDLGLRFAIPFGGEAYRGLSRPGASLTERNVDFSLARLGGGSSADFWTLSDEYRRKLLEQYRALANREISLGRHRRAAYIFAELLGDLTSAAATLASGGHFREAAILYEQRLNQPLSAAKCLQQGGLFAEAIAIYEKLAQWEIVAELYDKLDQREAARQALRRAVTARLTASDYLGAANLLEHKLQHTDEAQATLLTGWPRSAQAAACLDASFDLLARHGRHDEARRQVTALKPLTGTEQLQSLAAVLARAARKYPQPEVGHAAAEAARGLVAERLPRAATAETKNLLDALQSLVPADKLLGRDCGRYLAQRSADDAERRRQSLGSRLKRPELRVASWFHLPPAEWKTAVSIGDQFYAAGWHESRLMIVRGQWDGTIQHLSVPVAAGNAAMRSRPILLAADPWGAEPLYVYVAPGVPGSLASLTETDKFHRPVAVTPHSGCDVSTRVLTYGPGNTVLVGRLIGEGGAELALLLTPYENQRPLPGVQGIRFELEDLPDLDYIQREPLPFFCRAADHYLGIGPRLIHKRIRQTMCELPSPIVSITGSAPHTRPRIVVGCEAGGAILWGDTADAPHTTFATDLVEPAVGLNRGGWLAAATEDSVGVFTTEGGKLRFVSDSDGPQARPLAVLSTNDHQRFAIVTATGKVMIFEVPARRT
ncbi:MAG TPA: hypothetical protein VFB80_22645 [Pirellulaceae bacterium]|nr:hypothetical protein [Pirellulaceae bacterium]